MDHIQSRQRRGRVADAPSGHWVYRFLPKKAQPYAQLARWDRPIGWKLLLWPCWWSLAMALAASVSFETTLPGLLTSLWPLVLFLFGAILMRGAGCTFNDIVDQDIDEKVERSRSRPLPSGQVSERDAWVFLGIQALLGLVILLQFNTFAIFLGFASLVTVVIYPFAKRFTDWPQFFLGLAFSWGALMGWAVHFASLSAAPILLYLGSILWVIGYDTIYAHQDKEDDALVGVRSTALLFADRTKLWLTVLYGGALALIGLAFMAANVALPAYWGLILAALHMARQIHVLDINDADQCLSLFRSNSIVGWLIFTGLGLAILSAWLIPPLAAA